MKQPATPLPWEQNEDVFGHPYPYIVSIGTHTEAKDLVASCIDDNSDRGAKDAAYIVEACNAYPKLMEEREKLVEALEAARPHVEWICEHNKKLSSDGGVGSLDWADLKKIDAALASLEKSNGE